MPRNSSATREALLNAAELLYIQQGYAGTSLDDVCARACVTKGAFFHHFASKEELALTAVKRFHDTRSQRMQSRLGDLAVDPRARLLGFVDEVIATIKRRETPGCLIGTLAQELALSDGPVREACADCLAKSARAIRTDVAAARRALKPTPDWSVDSLSEHMIAVVQGSILLAKTHRSAAVGVRSLKHLRRYLELLLPQTKP